MFEPACSFYLEFKIEIYDVDDSNVSRLDSHDFLGRAEFTLADLVSAHQQRLNVRDDLGVLAVVMP